MISPPFLEVLNIGWTRALGIMCLITAITTVIRGIKCPTSSGFRKFKTCAPSRTEWAGLSIYFLVVAHIFWSYGYSDAHILELRVYLRLLTWGGALGVFVSNIIALVEMYMYDE